MLALVGRWITQRLFVATVFVVPGALFTDPVVPPPYCAFLARSQSSCVELRCRGRAGVEAVDPVLGSVAVVWRWCSFWWAVLFSPLLACCGLTIALTAGPPEVEDFHTLYIVTQLYECDLERIISSSQRLTDQHLQYVPHLTKHNPHPRPQPYRSLQLFEVVAPRVKQHDFQSFGLAGRGGGVAFSAIAEWSRHAPPPPPPSGTLCTSCCGV
jgi:hypothetical protein